MKKLIFVCAMLAFTLAATAQESLKSFHPFRSIEPFPYINPERNMVYLSAIERPFKWAWRFDATMAIAEVTRNLITKEWVTTGFSAVGPAIGVQKLIPRSITDPTPVNVFGASLGLALGKNILEPNVAELKTILALNIWEYLKLGGTFTANPPPDVGKLGFFVGGGITF